MLHSNGIYQKYACNYVESFFYLQLGVFAGSILYARHNNGSIRAIEDTSIGLSLLVLLIVLGYHVYVRFEKHPDPQDPPIVHEREND